MSQNKTCQNCKQGFVIEPQDVAFYDKMQVPPPTFCPECRLIRRLAWRNERSFYSRTCDKCKKPIISIYAPESGLTVYCSPCWWKDDWDALNYGVEFDTQKPFLVQLRELYQRVPQMNLHGLYTTLVNSDYTHMVGHLKDCYMVTYSDFGENLLYGSIVENSKDSVDNLMLHYSELCYETVNCIKCYHTMFSLDCENSSNVYFSRNCSNCNDCFGCVNLRNKQHCIFNEQYTKEEYQKRLEQLYPSSYSRIEEQKKNMYEHWQKFPQKFFHGTHIVESNGDYIRNCKNVTDSFDIMNAENCRFCTTAQGPFTDSYDFNHYGSNASLLYETLQSGDKVSNVRLSWWIVTNSENVEYSMYIVGSSNIFGSVGLRNKKYCILNKQYSKESFDKLRMEIIEQMNQVPYKDKLGNRYPYGEFFPIELSPFGYNESTAQEFFPIIKEEAIARGYTWREQETKNYQTTKQAEDLPETIEDIDDAITNEIIECMHHGQCNEQCSKAYRFVPAELAFYKNNKLPLPRLCPNCRHVARTQFRNPLKLWERNCQCSGSTAVQSSYKNTVEHFHKNEECPHVFKTAYSPDKPDIVYCEECYQTEVF